VQTSINTYIHELIPVEADQGDRQRGQGFLLLPLKVEEIVLINTSETKGMLSFAVLS
jgi:hypothetical protein